jgi:exosortase
VAGCLLIVLLGYRSTVAGLVWQWWDYLEYGFVLTGLAAWVSWRDRHLLLAEVAPWPPAALPIVGGSLGWVIGASAGIQVIEQSALLMVLMGWALAVLGRGQMPRVLRLGGYLALALPAWGLIIGILQMITVAANSVLLALSGLEATITGTFIAIPEGTFEVAAGCAGMSFFMSGLTVAVCYAEMTPLTVRGRWLAVALMASLSLVSNWIRVFLLIMIGHWTNMQSPLIADHGWFGWVIFAFMVMLFIWSTRFIEARYAVKLPGASLARGASTASVPFAGAMFGFTGLALLGPAAALVLDAIPRAPSPAQIAGLNGANQFIALPAVERRPLAFGDTVVAPPWAPQFAGADRHQVQRWVKGTDTVQVDRLVFSGRDRRHRLIADGNSIAPSRNIIVDRLLGVPDGTGVRSFRQALARVDSTSGRAIIYWFRVGSTSTGAPLAGRLLMVSTTLLRGAPAELVSTSVPCSADCDGAFAVLREFVLGPSPASEGRTAP